MIARLEERIADEPLTGFFFFHLLHYTCIARSAVGEHTFPPDLGVSTFRFLDREPWSLGRLHLHRGISHDQGNVRSKEVGEHCARAGSTGFENLLSMMPRVK